ncbi:MAG TPA: TetR/AcrR family transcriptional regulator [Deltaproteobacteria bacterium]|jgi:AcrR family transcriptional regulator|nr:TetR/AcrR family transcriptional regulator [Deltaproteobacteria bacterium]OQC29435.1 MAG: HTH-type transcriptional regulator AcrR [Deltaproteobacteria bacterium ADurb.Bin072]HRW80419.1 TetR/AcrR family transcriptional regulator [Desulfomonilia bacterium]NMD39909.1 TetR/AcrR family transcriptional regulator [Deltaproteobacteria bacterium]HNQ84309.1 TetR/AcrR family transcriptional regulator [Deltaproteobacteria bacterium]
MAKTSEKRREETRDRIIIAACELFSKYGYHNTQVMDIVKAVGMSAGTFYNHFKDKRDLFEQITIESLETLRVTVRSLREPVDIWNPLERAKILQDTFNAIFDFVDANPQQILMLLRVSFGVDEKLDGSVWDYFVGFAQDAGEDLQRWTLDGVIEGIDPMLFGTAVCGMTLQLIHSYLVEKKHSRQEIIENLITMILAMFEAYLTEQGKKALELARQNA